MSHQPDTRGNQNVIVQLDQFGIQRYQTRLKLDILSDLSENMLFFEILASCGGSSAKA